MIYLKPYLPQTLFPLYGSLSVKYVECTDKHKKITRQSSSDFYLNHLVFQDQILSIAIFL